MTKLFKLIEKIEEFVLSYGIIVVALLSVFNVISRTFFSKSFAFIEELSQFLIIAITFLGTSYAAGQARHIRMSALYDQLSDKNKKKLMIFITSFTALLSFILTIFAFQYTLTVKNLGTVSPAMSLPFYIVYSFAIIGLFLTGIQYSFALIKNLTSNEVYLSYTHKDEFIEEHLPESLEVE